ncbi:MAG: serine/threonine protein kinase [Candidatus Wallbacteria bacterium]|nr:serine/threonine protein kinase [Candidatus Wallbacteria bacterium]
MPVADTESLSGLQIGSYILKAKLGQGGMGVVYLAEQEGLLREVALKLLPEEQLGDSPSWKKRFLREASACAKLSHPNIVKVYDFGTDKGYYYYAMEVLRARSLQAHLEESGQASLELIFRVARDMASAMEHYHPRGLVHRDIKPANIVLDAEGRPVLTDFGLVKDLGATAITKVGNAVGTPYFMSPEMVKGEASPATDIWQVGVVLYRMATGQLPFPGERTADVLRSVLHKEPEAPTALNRSLPAALETLILNCLEKDPAVRYGTAAELLADAAAAARRAPVARRRVAAGGGGEADVPRLEPHRPAAAPAGGGRRAAARTPAFPTEPVTAPMEFSSPARPLAWGAAALTVLLAAALTYGWRVARPAPVAATDVAFRAGMKRTVVDWRITTDGESSVEWGAADDISTVVTPGKGTGLARTATLAPMEPGKSYRFALLLPGGGRSLSHSFEVPSQPLTPQGLEQLEDGLELTFKTAHPAAATASAGPSARITETTPSFTHTLRLTGRPLSLDRITIELLDAAGDTVRLEGPQVAALWQSALLEPLARETAARLAAYEPQKFLTPRIDRYLPASVCSGSSSVFTQSGFDGFLLGTSRGRTPHYERFRPNDPLARRMSGDLAVHAQGQPHTRLVRALTALAPDGWTGRRLSIPTAISLYSGLTKLASVDYYAAFLGVPYETGVRELLGEEWLSGNRRRLLSSSPSIVVSAPRAGSWSYPMNEALALKRGSFQLAGRELVGEHTFELTLQSPRDWKRAELTLYRTRIETELGFRVEINGGPALDIRHERQVDVQNPAAFRPDISLLFDPRFLVGGVNRLRVTVAAVPGTRYLGLKGYNSFAALGLAWEK